MKIRLCPLSICLLAALTSSTTINAKEVDLKHSTSAAIAYNSNVYRTNDGSYTDWSQATNPLINPDVQSGFFTDLEYELAGLYSLNKKVMLSGDLDIDGKFHLGSDLTNANKTRFKIDFGARRILSGENRRRSSIEGHLFIDNVDKTYYDRDTGLEKTATATDLTDVSERYSYRGNGFHFSYNNKTDKTIEYGVGLTIGSRDYTDTIANSQMDYSYTTLEADIRYQLQKATSLSAEIEREAQDYDERPSRNLAGSLFLSNPALEYTYFTLAFGIKHILSDNWTLHGDFKNKKRDDGWLNYNGYTAHKYKIRAIHKRDKVKTKISLSKQTRDYPNALAFDDPINGVNIKKTYDTLGWSLSREIEQSKTSSVWGKFAYNETDTNDLRYSYDRYIVSAGYKWKF